MILLPLCPKKKPFKWVLRQSFTEKQVTPPNENSSLTRSTKKFAEISKAKKKFCSDTHIVIRIIHHNSYIAIATN